jgi:hypothetical protein
MNKNEDRKEFNGASFDDCLDVLDVKSLLMIQTGFPVVNHEDSFNTRIF